MASSYFLKVDGIPGESRHPEHVGELELASVTWGESAGPPDLPSMVTFTLAPSRASPELFFACASGRRIAHAILTIHETAEPASETSSWRFSDIIVSAYSTAAGEDGPIDRVTLSADLVEALPERRPPALRFELLRPDDLLNLEVEAVNLRLDADDPAAPALVADGDAPARLTMTFPPQSIAETAYFEYSKVVPEDSPDAQDPDAGKLESEKLDPPGVVGGSERDSVARLANPSRLVFEVPAGTRLPYSVGGLLEWSQLQLAVHPIAAVPAKASESDIAGAPAIRPPEPSETALEMPYRLVISPAADVAWEHRRAPFTSAGRTELWHTRLTRKKDDVDNDTLQDEKPALRAIWSPDYDPVAPPAAADDDPNLGRTAMSPNDRHQIVILTSAFHGYEYEAEVSLFPSLPLARAGRPGRAVRFPLRLTYPFVPQPFAADLLMLSPLGGWLRSRGEWTPPRPVARRFPFQPDLGDLLDLIRADRVGPAPEVIGIVDRIDLGAPLAGANGKKQGQLDLSEWVHVAAQGRDHYVRIVYEGELKPFGNKASLIKVTERKFVELGNTTVGAYLFQRMFIVVREPVKEFVETDRAMPFKHVRLTTLVTPNIADPKHEAGTSRTFWVEVHTGAAEPERFMFHGVGTDIHGNTVDFAIPMLFASITDVADNLGAVVAAYNRSNSLAELAERELHVPGQKVAFAKRPDAGSRTTELVTERLNFVVDPGTNRPRLLKADVRIPQVEELLGTSAPTTIRLYQPYLDGDGGATEVFAEIAKPDETALQANPLTGIAKDTLPVTFTSDKAGGFATPNLGVSTLSSSLGPLAGAAEDAAAGTFVPTSFFPKGLALLFGSFDLGELLVGSDLAQNAPKLRTTRDGDTMRTKIEWTPDVASKDLGAAAFVADQGGTTELKVDGLIVKQIGGAGEPTFEFKGTLNAFTVSVLQSVFVNFETFTFESRNGEKPNVNVQLREGNPIRFGGDLTFVEELRNAIPPGLFGDGPSLDVTKDGIRAGFAFDLPPVAVGVFALRDVSLGAALTLPFTDGKPVFDFNVSNREHPFLLSVAIFGGGGFFHLQLDTAGMKELEAAFEFGVTAAINLGVASGSVHMMAGIYFSLKRVDPENELVARLGGFLRIGGSLKVLAIVTVSVEFNLSFTYDSKSEKAYGRATLTVEVEVAFFSASVELTVERAFGGKSGDPTFRETFETPAVWEDYAMAFA